MVQSRVHGPGFEVSHSRTTRELFAKMKILPVIFMTLVALGLLIPACSGDGGGDDSGTSGAAAAVHSYLLTK